MRRPIFVRPLHDEERTQIAARLRSSDAVTFRRRLIVLASARGERVPDIARALACNEQTVRDAIHAFNAAGLAALHPQPRRPHRRPQTVFTAERVERLQALLHRSPRDFGHPTNLWTLDLAAEEAARQGITPRRVSGETIRAALAQHGVHWRRAKHWITSPEVQYARKGRAQPADPPDRLSAEGGAGRRG